MRSNPREAAVLTDVDGALAPIVTDPAAAGVPEVVRRTLAGLASEYALVGCVSGRRVEQALKIVRLPQLAYAGNHGFEIRTAGSETVEASPALQGHEHDAADFLGGLDRDVLAAAGIRFEDKGPIQALHWRGADDEAAAGRLADTIAAEIVARGLIAHHGRMVLEIRPPVELDKGTAVTGLLAGAPAVRHAFYGGDDNTDLDAFAALRRLRDGGRLETAVCVGISSPEGPPAILAEADVVVNGPKGYAELLASLALPAE